MAINRTKQEAAKPASPTFSVGLNVVLSGSKTMTAEQQEAAMPVAKVRVLIVDASNPKNVLLDTTAEAREFGTGSVGYGVQEKGLTFPK